MSKKKKILIVEDDKFLSDIYKEKFEGFKYNVLISENGKEALKVLKKEDVDLILLDLVMPKMTGFNFLEVIRKKNIAEGVPVIVLTNLGQEEDKKKCASYGVCEYFVKVETTPEIILKKVKSLLKK
jgi:DNA-binding response OmpR family regulator